MILNESLKKGIPYMVNRQGTIIQSPKIAGMHEPIHPYIFTEWEGEDEYLTDIDTYYETLNNNDLFLQGLVFLKENYPQDAKLVNKVASFNMMLLNDDENAYVEHYEQYFTTDDAIYDYEEIKSILVKLNDDLNNNFMRVRTGGLFDDENNNEIYFRISSNGFNWFDVIWQIVYDNKALYKTVTVIRDETDDDFYKIDNELVNSMPVDTFINASGRPIIESKNTDSTLYEENELKKRARWAKKRQKGRSPFMNTDAGDVEKNVAMFNRAMGTENSSANMPSSGESTGMGE